MRGLDWVQAPFIVWYFLDSTSTDTCMFDTTTLKQEIESIAERLGKAQEYL